MFLAALVSDRDPFLSLPSSCGPVLCGFVVEEEAREGKKSRDIGIISGNMETCTHVHQLTQLPGLSAINIIIKVFSAWCTLSGVLCRPPFAFYSNCIATLTTVQSTVSLKECWDFEVLSTALCDRIDHHKAQQCQAKGLYQGVVQYQLPSLYPACKRNNAWRGREV